MEPKGIPPVTPATFEKIVSPWLQGIDHGDITVVMSYPTSDRHRRYLHLVSHKPILKKYLPNHEKYIWVAVDFRVDSIDDVADLEACILRKISEQVRFAFTTDGDFVSQMRLFESKTQKRVILTGFGGEILIQRQNSDILAWFTIQRRIDSLRLLLFFETNLFSPQSIELFSQAAAFMPRLEILKLYEEPDIRQFLTYLSKKWDFTIPAKIIEEIIDRCGGVLFFIKEAVRFIRDHPQCRIEDVFLHPEMQFNMSTFWQALGVAERRILEKLVRGEILNQIQDKAAVDYLTATGIIKLSGQSHTITVPLLKTYIRSTLNINKHLEIDAKGDIYLDAIPIATHFSRKERRILSLLISTPDKIVSREQVAAVIWPFATPEHYSDWAIDSHISRLRKRLVSLGLDSNTLQTRKGKGFLWQGKE